MTKQQEVQSVWEWLSMAEISHVLRNKVGWQQMRRELSLDGKTTDWWKVTESFVQSSEDCIGVLYNCYCVRGFCINYVLYTHAQGQERKWKMTTSLGKDNTHLVSLQSHEDKTGDTCYWKVHKGENFKEELQKECSSTEEHPTVVCLL